jgi:hypothetical protein
MSASASRLADVQEALASAQEAAASSAAESAAAQAHVFTLESELKNTATRLFAAEAALGAAAAENSEHVRVAGHSARLKTLSFSRIVSLTAERDAAKSEATALALMEDMLLSANPPAAK